MLQRIQTVYFALAVILIAIPLLGVDFATINLDGQVYSMESFSVYSTVKGKLISDPNDFWGLQLVLILLLIFIITSFKNRGRQIFLGWIAFTLTILSAFWVVLGAYVRSISCTMCDVSGFTIQTGTYIFTLATIFIFLGVRGVRKDKMLVDSLNRLR